MNPVNVQLISFPRSNICVQSIFLEGCLKTLRNIPLLVYAEILRVLPSSQITIPLKSLKVIGRDDVYLLLQSFSGWTHLRCTLVARFWCQLWYFLSQALVNDTAFWCSSRCLIDPRLNWYYMDSAFSQPAGLIVTFRSSGHFLLGKGRCATIMLIT